MGKPGWRSVTQRVEGFHIRPLAAGDRARFVESWRGVQARFVDGPAGAVTEADHLLGDVMSTRGYPVSNFEQTAADISVDHPLVLESYRTAHEIALKQTRGQAEHGRITPGNGSLPDAFRGTGRRARNACGQSCIMSSRVTKKKSVWVLRAWTTNWRLSHERRT